MAKKRIDQAVREKVIEAHGSGLSMRKISARYGMSLSSVSRIVNEQSEGRASRPAGRHGANADRQRKIEELERRLEDLERRILAAESKKGCRK